MKQSLGTKTKEKLAEIALLIKKGKNKLAIQEAEKMEAELKEHGY